MREQILLALDAAPKVLERVMRAFPHDRFDDRTEADRFTPREAIAHLADHEWIVLDRIRVANMRPGETFEWYDPTDRAKDHRYSDKDVFHEAEVYESRRATTLEYLRTLEDADWDKRFRLSNGAEMSIGEYAVAVLAHDMYHLEQISHYFANEVATIS